MGKAGRILIWIVFIFGGIALSAYLDNEVFGWGAINDSLLYFTSTILGVLLFVAAFLSVGNVGRTLAAHGRKGENLPRLETDTLVTGGVYSLMRHPMHQLLMLFPPAFALMMASPSFIFLVAPLEVLIIYILILKIEEPEARRKFGAAYEEYEKQTPRFCFKWNCIRALMKNPDAKI